MSQPTTWRELHRTSNARELLAIITSIAAMEFDVRCVDAHGHPASAGDLAEGELRIIQVRSDDHAALLDVLDEIVAEQDEFDAMLERKAWTAKQVVCSLIALAGIAILLWLTLMSQ